MRLIQLQVAFTLSIFPSNFYLVTLRIKIIASFEIPLILRNSFFTIITRYYLFAAELMKAGNTVILRNAKIDMFKGSMRLAVDKWGRIELAEPANLPVKEDNNLSLVEYELVNVVEDS